MILAATDPTSAADWLAAWGQVGGAAATTVAVVVALPLAARDQRWRRADQADRDALRARLITVELDYNIDSSPGKISLIITNVSDSPILDVTAEAIKNLKQPNLKWMSRTDLPGVRPSVPVLRPQETFESIIQFFEEGNSSDHVIPDAHNDVTIRFTDIKGQPWRRVNNWEPERLPIKHWTAKRPHTLL